MEAAALKVQARALDMVRETCKCRCNVPEPAPVQIPETATVRDVAATLLAFFCALPTPLMPAAAAQVCDYWAPPKAAAASLLGDTLSPAELAVFRHTTGEP